jgi:hypothetical protein
MVQAQRCSAGIERGRPYASAAIAASSFMSSSRQPSSSVAYGGGASIIERGPSLSAVIRSKNRDDGTLVVVFLLALDIADEIWKALGIEGERSVFCLPLETYGTHARLVEPG